MKSAQKKRVWKEDSRLIKLEKLWNYVKTLLQQLTDCHSLSGNTRYPQSNALHRRCSSSPPCASNKTVSVTKLINHFLYEWCLRHLTWIVWSKGHQDFEILDIKVWWCPLFYTAFKFSYLLLACWKKRWQKLWIYSHHNNTALLYFPFYINRTRFTVKFKTQGSNTWVLQASVNSNIQPYSIRESKLTATQSHRSIGEKHADFKINKQVWQAHWLKYYT